MKPPIHLLLSSIHLFFISILALIGLIAFMNTTHTHSPLEEGTTYEFCGVITPSYGNAELGDELFTVHCATCHAKNMRTDATGPALSKTMENWSGDTLAIWSYLKNSQRYFQNYPESRIVKVHQQYQTVKPNFQNELSQEDFYNIMAYIEAR